MLWGLGIAIAAGLLSGSSEQGIISPVPKGMVPSQANILNTSFDSTSRDMRPESMPQAALGNPGAPGTMSPSMYLTNSPSLGSRTANYTVEAEGNGIDSRQLQQLLNSGLPGASGNVSINDARARLNAQSIADIMEGF